MFDRAAKLADDDQNGFDRWQHRTPVLAFPISRVTPPTAKTGGYEYAARLARVVLWAAEINVVATKHKSPRSFNSRNTEADERSSAEVRERSIRQAERDAPG